MRIISTSGQEIRLKPYQQLKDDPKFDLIRKLINNFPPEKLINLKKYIKDLEKS